MQLRFYQILETKICKFLWTNPIFKAAPCVKAARTPYSYHRSTLPQFVFADWRAPLQNAIWVATNYVAVKVFKLCYLLTAKITFGQNPGPKMFSKSLIMLFSPWVNLGDWEQACMVETPQYFPTCPLKRMTKGLTCLISSFRNFTNCSTVSRSLSTSSPKPGKILIENSLQTWSPILILILVYLMPGVSITVTGFSSSPSHLNQYVSPNFIWYLLLYLLISAFHGPLAE